MEDFVLTTEILTQFEYQKPEEHKISAIILLCENPRMKDFFETDLMGQKMKDWVFETVKDFSPRFVELKVKDDPFEVIKPFLKDEDYTIVLYSDTPLLTSSTVEDILDYTTTKKLDFCRLKRGFVINTKRFKSMNIELSADANFVDEKEFFAVFDMNTLSIARNKLKSRIVERHLKNGVDIVDVSSTYIENFVQIGKNVSIRPNNVLKGETVIEDGVVLFENNVLENAKVGKNSTVFCSVIKNKKINNYSKIGPFENLEEKEKNR